VADEEPPTHIVSGVGGAPSGEGVGTPTLVETAREEWLIEGYGRALRRFREASGARRPQDMFLALFEALNYATSLIEKMADSDIAPVMQGVRYVRNRVHHQWAAALVGRDVPAPRVIVAGGAVRSRVIGPPVVFDWFWKPAAELPLPSLRRPDRKGRAAYEDLLAGRPASAALSEIESALNARHVA
jgi:hypothetical protein